MGKSDKLSRRFALAFARAATSAANDRGPSSRFFTKYAASSETRSAIRFLVTHMETPRIQDPPVGATFSKTLRELKSRFSPAVQSARHGEILFSFCGMV